MKNPNGAGSVYKLTGKRRKPWNVVITVGYDKNGKQLRKSCGTFATKKEALVKLSECIVNDDIYKNNIKLSQVIKERNIVKKLNKETLKGYNFLERKLINFFGDLEIKKYTEKQIQDFINKTEATESAVIKLRSIFNFAFEKRYIPISFASNLVPFVEKRFSVERTEYTESEIQIVWDYIEANKERILEFKTTKEDRLKVLGALATIILIYTGLRIEEFVALRMEDVDLEKDCIFVNRSKTKTGIRVVPIKPEIKHYLEFLQVFKKFPKFENPNNKALYVPDIGNALLNRKINYRRRIQDISMELLGVKHNPHDTRHTFASKLDRSGVTPFMIQKLLGHSTPRVSGIYIHKTLEELQEMIVKIK